ncbi:hypothetical protein EON82_08565 [bacterium]|nr:MAG: hypothetical protein EON82_08565 [bacterium]
MAIDLLVVTLVFAVGNLVWGHFEAKTPLWRRWAKYFAFLVITALLSAKFGHVGVATMLGLGFVAAVVVHGWWLPKHGINGWTGEPREAYERLRGWRA